MTVHAMTFGCQRFAALAFACLTALTVSACSSEDDPGTTPVGDEPTTDLTITLQSIPGMGSEPVTYTLTCEPVGGDLEDADAACSALADADPDPFATVPPTEACLQVIKGPGEITIVGTWDGEAIDTVFTQHNSCESERFDRIVSTLDLDVGA
jgi:hypothetical protein